MGLAGTSVVTPAEAREWACSLNPWTVWVPAPWRKTTPGVSPTAPTGRRSRASTCVPSACVRETVVVDTS